MLYAAILPQAINGLTKVAYALRIKCYITDVTTVTINPLTGILKPQSNTVNWYMAVDGWAVTFGTARRDLGGLESRPVPS